MMTLWLILVVLTVGIVALLVYPFLVKSQEVAASTADYDLQVYKKQLREVGRDRDRGVISAEDAEAAEAEIGRRILAADQQRQRQGGVGSGPSRPWAAVMLLAVVVPGGAYLIYDRLGSPGLPNFPYAERSEEIRAAQTQQNRVQGMEQAMAQLEARLASDPDNLDGWMLLGRSHVILKRYLEAVQAYERAVALDGGNPNVLGPYGEALVLAAQGQVTEEAEATFRRVVAIAPGDPRANFFLAQADYQKSRYQASLDRLLPILAQAKGDETWLPGVLAMARGVAGELDQDISAEIAALEGKSGLNTPAMPQPSELEAMSEDERQEMIEGMVDRLAARLEENPDDLEGWRRLARAYQVLGRREAALAAYDGMIRAGAEEVPVLLAKAEAIRAFNNGEPNDESAALMARVLELNPDQLEATWYSALAALRNGDKTAAKSLFDRVLAGLDPQSPEYGKLAAEVDRLMGEEG
ncbi:c-type cytochrome biogenesis protein CcmI [Aestuariispira insulae]|uniref:Cytochrome c-type biogenesis protein CcmH n=1 Tax=Aestuariispira insulae TaxID=1461337 RepID=A0A3D9HPX3_9PROT|nr:c-type cytochrome biogenesis protein CcmI [Aestuariispira insulae]RED51563.1 cytochrome c-type biogenesis protein CcmH [Aestuariispira insulae]